MTSSWTASNATGLTRHGRLAVLLGGVALNTCLWGVLLNALGLRLQGLEGLAAMAAIAAGTMLALASIMAAPRRPPFELDIAYSQSPGYASARDEEGLQQGA